MKYQFQWFKGYLQPCSVCGQQIRLTRIDDKNYCGECLSEKLAGQLQEISVIIRDMRATIDKYEGDKCKPANNSN